MYARLGRNNISDVGSDPKDLEKNTNSKTWLPVLVSLTKDQLFELRFFTSGTNTGIGTPTGFPDSKK